MKRKRGYVFVGEFTRKVQRGGWVRFPKDWLTLLGDSREVFISPDPGGGKSLSIVAADDFRKELKRMSVKESSNGACRALAEFATLVKIAAYGRMRIPASLLVHAGIQDGVCFAGNVRTIVVTQVSRRSVRRRKVSPPLGRGNCKRVGIPPARRISHERCRPLKNRELKI